MGHGEFTSCGLSSTLTAPLLQSRVVLKHLKISKGEYVVVKTPEGEKQETAADIAARDKAVECLRRITDVSRGCVRCIVGDCLGSRRWTRPTTSRCGRTRPRYYLTLSVTP